MLAATFTIAQLQDKCDLENGTQINDKLLLRLLTNLNKYYTAQKTVENIHHCIDILAGNGTIETFSNLPRLLRDAIVCENWEGTHYTLWMQILRDIHKSDIDTLFINHIKYLLNDIDSHSNFKTQLENSLILLQKQLNELKKNSEPLQSLIIQRIVAHMSALFSAVCLLKEALSQKANYASDSKLRCLELFYLIELSQEDIIYNQDYLILISNVIGVGTDLQS